MHRANWVPVQQHHYYPRHTVCPKSILEAPKDYSPLVPCMDSVINSATLLYTILKSLSGHPDCVGYHSVMMDDDTKVWTYWFLSSNNFSQCVQYIAITSSTDSPISGEKVQQQNVSGIPNAKGYNFTPFVDFFISIFDARLYFHIRVSVYLVWHDTT